MAQMAAVLDLNCLPMPENVYMYMEERLIIGLSLKPKNDQ
jgi:hypothetical protein